MVNVSPELSGTFWDADELPSLEKAESDLEMVGIVPDNREVFDDWENRWEIAGKDTNLKLRIAFSMLGRLKSRIQNEQSPDKKERLARVQKLVDAFVPRNKK